MKILVAILVLLLSGCSYHATNGNDANQCSNVQESCMHTGIYDEWMQKNGDIICTCHQS